MCLNPCLTPGGLVLISCLSFLEMGKVSLGRMSVSFHLVSSLSPYYPSSLPLLSSPLITPPLVLPTPRSLPLLPHWKHVIRSCCMLSPPGAEAAPTMSSHHNEYTLSNMKPQHRPRLPAAALTGFSVVFQMCHVPSWHTLGS